MSTCVIKYDTEASPQGPKRALPFKGPTPVNQEGDTFIYREKEEGRNSIENATTLAQQYTDPTSTSTPLIICSHSITNCPFAAVIIFHYVIISLTLIHTHTHSSMRAGIISVLFIIIHLELSTGSSTQQALNKYLLNAK